MRRPHTRRRLGLGLMVSALVGAMVLADPAFAQDGDDEAQEVEAPVQARALVAYPANDVIPDTVLNGFPPQVLCVIRPDLCPEELEPLRGPIGEALGAIDDNQETLPIQPADPNGLTVSFLGGTPRYASAVQVQLPEVPDGEEIDQFVLTVPQGQPSFSFDSPVFRRVVGGIIQTAGSQDPEVFAEQMQKALDEEPFTQPPVGIEACPLTLPIPEDAEAPRSVPVRDISEENADGELEPAVDCLYGTNGSFDEDAGTWSFDLTFAAQAWADGELENHGIFLRPTGAPNLAFGDPDTSTNAQVVLDVSEPPRALMATSEPPPPVEPLAPLAPAPSQPADTGTADAGTTTGSTGTSAPTSTPISTPPSAPSGGTAMPDTPAAEVAPPATAPPSAGGEEVALEATPAGQQGPATPWTVWLLVLPFAGGAWLTARSLGEELVVAGGTGTGTGALSRLTGDLA